MIRLLSLRKSAVRSAIIPSLMNSVRLSKATELPVNTRALFQNVLKATVQLLDRMTMQIKLEEAVAAEDYEKAALYRDYLKVLNHGTDTKDGQE